MEEFRGVGCGVGVLSEEADSQEPQNPFSESASASQITLLDRAPKRVNTIVRVFSYETGVRGPKVGPVQAETELCRKSGDDFRAHCVPALRKIALTLYYGR